MHSIKESLGGTFDVLHKKVDRLEMVLQIAIRGEGCTTHIAGNVFYLPMHVYYSHGIMVKQLPINRIQNSVVTLAKSGSKPVLAAGVQNRNSDLRTP